MKKKLVIIGCGETAELAFEYFTVDSEFQVVGFVVDKAFINNSTLLDLPIVSFEDMKAKFPSEENWVFIAIGASRLNRDRSNLYLRIKELGYKIATYISSRASVWRNVEVGENCFIFENNTIQSKVKIGNNVTIWSGNHVGHNSIIKDNCFISSHVVISGFCEVGANSFLGVNSTVIDEIKIGSDCFIGAGALIQKNLPPNTVVQEFSTKYSKVSSSRLFKFQVDD